MKDLKWKWPAAEVPKEGPDTKQFYHICKYTATIHMRNYDQWIEVEISLDLSVQPPQFWRKITAGVDDVKWHTAKMPV